jgi:MFS family permease
MLAEQFGPRAILASAAGMSLLAWLIQRLDQTEPPTPNAPHAPLLPALRRPALWVPLLGAALPVKMVLAGYLFYLLPLALRQEDYGSSATGRAMMIYFLLVAAINPLASWLADRYGWRMTLVLLGGCVVGAGGLGGVMGGVVGLTIGIVGLGIGTGLSAAALQAHLSQQGPAAIVLLRTLERLGAVLGPLLAGWMLGGGSYQDTMLMLGVITLAATLGLGLYQLHQHSRSSTPCEP